MSSMPPMRSMPPMPNKIRDMMLQMRSISSPNSVDAPLPTDKITLVRPSVGGKRRKSRKSRKLKNNKL